MPGVDVNGQRVATLKVGRNDETTMERPLTRMIYYGIMIADGTTMTIALQCTTSRLKKTASESVHIGTSPASPASPFRS